MASENQYKERSYVLASRPVSINGIINNAIDAYRKDFIPMEQLLSDYAAFYLNTLPPANPYAGCKKGHKSLYERGATVAESLKDKVARQLKDYDPTRVISALFYNTGNNDSAFECAVMRKLLNAMSEEKQCVVVNPSPDFLLDDFCDNSSTIYLVPDLLVAKLYRKQFSTDRIKAFKEIIQLPDIDRLVIMQRQYPHAEKLFMSFRYLADDARIFALLPHSEIQDSNSAFWDAVCASSLSVLSAVRVDPAVVSTPKKKTLVSLGTTEQGAVDLWDSIYDENTHVIKLFGPVREYNFDRFFDGMLSMLKMLNGPKEPKTEKKRNPASKYKFSNEITINYTVKTDQCGKPKITAYYRAIQPDRRKRKGKKLTDDIIHRANTGETENVLERIPFEVKCKHEIANDVRNYYAGSLNLLSLKTCWFLSLEALEADREYNHEQACRLFYGNNVLSQIKLQEATESDVINALEAVFGCTEDEIEYRYLRQLNLIIKKIIRGGFAIGNPLEKYVQSRSNGLTASQREVRDALAKRNLEPPEMRRVIEYLSAEEDGKKKYAEDSLYVAGWIRLLTGMTNAEIRALTWNDYIKLEYGMGSQLRITKRMTDKGKIVSYGTKDMPKIRDVPNSAELQFILGTFYTHIEHTTGLSEKELGKIPIVASKDSLNSQNPEPITTRQMDRFAKELLKVAGIDPLIVSLHDGEDETEVDLNSYKGDFFRVNAYHFFRHVCNIQDGEACYLIGKVRPTTFDQYYYGFPSELAQYRMAQEMRRGLAVYDELIGMPCTPATSTGLHQLRRKQQVTSDGRHTVAAQILFQYYVKSDYTLRINAASGLRWNIFYKGA